MLFLLPLLPCLVASLQVPSPRPLHNYMSERELHYYFETAKPSSEDYELVHIESFHLPMVNKRNGEEPENHATSKVLEFSALGRDYKLHLEPNSQLVAPYAVMAKRGHANRKSNDHKKRDMKGYGALKPQPEIKTGLTKEIDVSDIDDWVYNTDDEWQWLEDDVEGDYDIGDRDMSMEEVYLDRMARNVSDCMYLHKSEGMVAAITHCDGDTHGLVLEDDSSLEILPLNSRLKRMLELWRDEYTDSVNQTSVTRQPRNYHIVKRRGDYSTRPFLDHVKDLFNDQDNTVVDYEEEGFDRSAKEQVKGARKKRAGGEKVLETAVFMDAAAYRRFEGYFRRQGVSDSDGEVQKLLLSYMNGIQAIYMMPSLGHEIKFRIVRLEMWRNDPRDFYHHQGDREPLLNSFCDYQARINPTSDDDPGHWDLALYVSGLNFYAMDSRGKNGVTMGLARVGGMCSQPHACVIGELGVTTDRGKPYPSAGFTSTYVMAHEIGHNLGMSHDHKVGCDRNGFVMSESRGTKGESRWSSCSRNSLNEAFNKGFLNCLNDNNANKVENLGMDTNTFPGEVWSPDDQCKILLLDSNARADHGDSDLADMCYSIKCRTPSRDGYYRAGPALEGTVCGDRKWCRDGACVENDKQLPGAADPGKWSEWSFSGCQSGCTPQSRGYRTKVRYCIRGKVIHTLKGCKGPSTGIDFCDDTAICAARKSIDDYASDQCSIFSSYVSDIDPAGTGTQARYMSDKKWLSCAIFCKRANNRGWYTPRMELNDLPISPYFPDGTLCHSEGGSNFYCKENECVDTSSRTPKQDKIQLSIFNNAVGQTEGEEPPAQLKEYFTLDKNMNPVGGEFIGLPDEEEGEQDLIVDDL